jgi:hypothetical protein
MPPLPKPKPADYDRRGADEKAGKQSQGKQAAILQPEAILAELRDLPRWACWTAGPQGKPPINPRTGGHAKCNDKATWGTFAEAVAALPDHDGLSFALNGDGIVGIDLDDCREPIGKTISERAAKIIQRFASYTEITPSGEGVRIFVRGRLPQNGRKKGDIEVYDSNKFLSVTGRKLTSHGAGDGIQDRAAELLAWHREVFDHPAASTKKNGEGRLVVNNPPNLDQGRLDRLFRVKPKAGEIFSGDREGYASQSEADLALASFATQAGWSDQEVCDRLVQARLNVGEPVKPESYFERTIAKARGGPTAENKAASIPRNPGHGPDTSTNRDGHAAHSVSPEGYGLARQLAQHLRPDDVEIGVQGYTPGEQHDTASWADLAESNAGIRWLVKGWVPYDMLTGIVAEPKAGKSAFVLWALVRPIITGCGWFPGQVGSSPGYVVWCDTERRAAVNLDRAAKWNLPVGRILTPFTDKRQVVNIDDPEHIKRIMDVVCRHKARLVVVDSYRGAHAGDENNSKISTGLQALAGVCEETHAACSVIHHARKMSVGEDLTINCGRGSNAFLAAVACQIAIDRPDPKGEWRRVQLLGENLGVAPRPVGFRVTDKGLEIGPVPKRPQNAKKETGKDRAEQWLRVKMKPGRWYPAAEVIAEAEAAGFPHSGTLQRAKAALRVETRKSGKSHEWRRDDITDGPVNT